MKVKIINYKKEYQIINHSEVVLETRKPKWYSSEINFNYNDKLYEIKKSSFWGLSYTIFELKRPIGKIKICFTHNSFGVIRLKIKNETYNEYTLREYKVGKWYSSETRYVLNTKDLIPVLTIHYDNKNKGSWVNSADIRVSFNDLHSADLSLLVFSLFLMVETDKELVT